MKAILGVLVVAALGVGAWVLFSGGAETPEAVPQSSTVEEEKPEETAEDLAEEVQEEASEAVETVEEKVDDLKEQAEEAVESVKTEVDEAVSNVEEQVDEAAEAIKNQAQEAAEEGASTVKNAVENALGGLSNAPETSEAATGDNAQTEADETANLEHDAQRPLDPGLLDQALTVETFDGLAIREALEASDLDALSKKTVESLVTLGEENPDQLQDVISKMREIFGI